MSNSTLATLKVPAYVGNYTKGRKSKITKITLHHMGGVLSAKRCGALFQDADRNASSHYGIGNDGTIALYVNEADTAWADGDWDSNCQSVSIETSNSVRGGNWPVSDAALKSLIKLVADIAKRNNLGTLVKGKNLTWHSMYDATACPGPYLLSKMDYIVAEANKLNAPKATPVAGYITGIDTTRGENALIVYKKGTNGKTGTNKWGTEVALDKNFKVISKPVQGVGNMAIPAGGYVLSGHGVNSTWLLNKAKVGVKLNFKVGG